MLFRLLSPRFFLAFDFRSAASSSLIRFRPSCRFCQMPPFFAARRRHSCRHTPCCHAAIDAALRHAAIIAAILMLPCHDAADVIAAAAAIFHRHFADAAAMPILMPPMPLPPFLLAFHLLASAGNDMFVASRYRVSVA